MVDIYKMQAVLTFKVPTGEVQRIKNLVNAALSGSPIGIAKGLLGTAGMGALAGGAVAGAIVVSSPMLQNTLKHLIRVVMLLFRPIGDIISIGLRPIIDILRPIGLFFRILIQPYIRKAMEAMRLGRQFLMKGEYAKVIEAYTLGAMYILKPLFDMFVTIATITIEGVLAGFRELGTAILIALRLPGVAQAFSESMDKMIQTVGIAGAQIIVDTSVAMETWLVNLKSDYESMKNIANVGMMEVNLVVGGGFVKIIENITNYYAPSIVDETNKIFEAILENAQRAVNELYARTYPGRVFGGVAWTPTGYVSTKETTYPITTEKTTNINIDVLLSSAGFVTDPREYFRELADEINRETRYK